MIKETKIGDILSLQPSIIRDHFLKSMMRNHDNKIVASSPSSGKHSRIVSPSVNMKLSVGDGP